MNYPPKSLTFIHTIWIPNVVKWVKGASYYYLVWRGLTLTQSTCEHNLKTGGC